MIHTTARRYVEERLYLSKSKYILFIYLFIERKKERKERRMQNISQKPF